MTGRVSSTASQTADPHAAHPTSLAALVRGLVDRRHLIGQMVRRDVLGRYRGSAMGLVWSFFNPLLMLAVYTFVFSEVFKARWHGEGPQEAKAVFAIVLFVGMIILGLFTEVINRAPTLILHNANYVTKVVFPLEVLPVVAAGTALFHALVSLAVLLIAQVCASGAPPHWTVLLFPLVLLPLVVLTVGIAWVLASLGVFLRDVAQTIAMVSTVLTFLSPVFYPVTAVPPRFRAVIAANPLTFIIEQAREVLVWGHLPDWFGLAQYMVASLVVAWLGFAWFQKTRKGFADVL